MEKATFLCYTVKGGRMERSVSDRRSGSESHTARSEIRRPWRGVDR